MVAGHRFCVEGEAEVLALMDNYAPFGCEAGDTIATLHIAQGEAPTYQEEMHQDDEGQTAGSTCSDSYYPTARQDGSLAMPTIATPD